MKQSALMMMAWLLALGCGGHATERDSAAGGAGAQAGGGLSGGAGQAPMDYVPSASVPYDEQDTQLAASSFEGGQGTGWDTCFTRTPGSVIWGADDTSHGRHSLELAAGPCEGPCSPDGPSDSQVYLSFLEGKHPMGRTALYVDWISYEQRNPIGSFALYAVNVSCETQRLLVDVPLSALALSGEWSTRCFDLSFEPEEHMGLAVDGQQYHVGLDALRLGPACQ